ncbi:unnamed protein product [Paramecium octaurelia]|uniref:EGF-like domain-containing protein n=1 Tax=Paramecium octaurelia TaxID=43137 RepID=A0A8S1TF24_PAROT|nr:unnamed protein product [Paramecium octaurelia]
MQIWLFGLLQIIPFAYSQCTTRQYDDGAGGCLDCLTQCATCTTGTTCDTCTLRYYQSGSDCLICDPSCKECSGTSSYCTNCDTSQNLYLDQVTNTCIACDSPKYKDGINCVDTCPVYINLADFTCVALCDSNCLTCAIYSNSCTTCDASNYLDLTSNQCVTACDINCSTCLTTTTNCQSCSTGMYLDNITTASGTCKQCNSPCSVCQSPSDVEVCTDCQSTYYLDGASTCQLCDPTCYECTGSLSTECSQCVLGKYLITNGSDKSCESCVAPCDNCSSDTICDSCVSQYYLNGTACDPCTSPCFTCETTDTHCLTCAPGDNRVLINNQCICDQNFFDQNNGDYVCPPCDANCKTCVDSATKCTSCYDKFYLDSNVCQPCHWNCLTCVTTATNCLSCDEVVNLRIFYNNQCLCVNGQYYSDSQQICAQCVDPCQYCLSGKDSNGVDYNGTQCSSCQAIYNRIISGTICVCKSGYFDAGFLACQPCASYCISCLTSETDCDVCKPNTFRDSTKKCQCLDGYFGTSTVCQPCTSPCLNCEISNTHCLSCITGVNRVLSSNACICAPGYYETTTSPKVCQPCTPPCATCKYFPDKCFSCIAKYYQPSGQLTCLPCDVPCEECAPNDGTKCKTCLAVQNREVLNQVCVCKIDYYQLDNVTPCSQCIAPCYECEDNGDGTQCVSCKAGDNRTVDTNKQCIFHAQNVQMMHLLYQQMEPNVLLVNQD